MNTPLQKVLRELPSAKKTGSGYIACCPAHDDRKASLSIAETDDDRVLLHCHAGCKIESICFAMGLKVAELTCRQSAHSSSPGRIAETYDYCDSAGDLVFQVVRYSPKTFRQRRPKPGGGWNWSTKGIAPLPYRLPDLLNKPRSFVVVVEGERDVNALYELGIVATCNAGGAGKWKPAHSESLQGEHVAIIPDNDPTGHKHADTIARSLIGVAQSVRIVKLPGLPDKGDVRDYLNRFKHSDFGDEYPNPEDVREQLMQRIAVAEVWQPAAEPWPELQSFEKNELPAFPTDCLPEYLGRWVKELSHATQTPADLAGMLSLAVVASTIARRVTVHPREGWTEPTNIYTAILLPPGNRKSAVFAEATAPLRDLEQDLINNAKPEFARQQSARRLDEKRLHALEQRASRKGDLKAREEAQQLAAALSLEPPLALPRLIVDDATSEKLGMILQEQNGRIASMSPEGGVFDLMAGMYSRNGMPQFNVYLMGHAGDRLTCDRVTRETVVIERPAITCAYAMQPQIVQGLAVNTAFRGRGLLARFLYAAPLSLIGERKIAAGPVSEPTREIWRDKVQSLGSNETLYELGLNEQARQLLVKWEAEIEDRLAEGGSLESLRDWGSKLAGATLRMAAAMHCWEHQRSGVIGYDTFAAAIKIARYLIAHAEHVFATMHATEDPIEADAHYILRWVERKEVTRFKRSELHASARRRFQRSHDMTEPLSLLVERGYFRVAEPSPGDLVERYEVNPAVDRK